MKDNQPRGFPGYPAAVSAYHLPRIEFAWSRRDRGGAMFPVEWCGFISGKIFRNPDIWIDGKYRVGSKRKTASHDNV